MRRFRSLMIWGLTALLLPATSWSLDLQQQFRSRLATVDALLAALSSEDPHYGEIAQLRDRANTTFSGNAAEGGALLEQAYQLLKLAIRDQRSGTTPIAPDQSDSSKGGDEQRYQRRRSTVDILLTTLRDGGGAFDQEAAGCHQADQLHREGASTAAGEALDRCYARLRQAVVAQRYDATPVDHGESGQAGRGEELYLALARSVEALAAAYRAILGEEQAGDQSALAGRIDQQRERAGELFGSGDLEGAMDQLKASYQLLKVAVVDARQGTTLIKSLEFASAEDEYRYELDRLETYRMLYHLLSSGKGQSADARLLDTSEELKQSAGDMAARALWEEAIRTLELATSELKKGIRRAGFLLPG